MEQVNSPSVTRSRYNGATLALTTPNYLVFHSQSWTLKTKELLTAKTPSQLRLIGQVTGSTLSKILRCNCCGRAPEQYTLSSSSVVGNRVLRAFAECTCEKTRASTPTTRITSYVGRRRTAARPWVWMTTFRGRCITPQAGFGRRQMATTLDRSRDCGRSSAIETDRLRTTLLEPKTCAFRS